jgi:DNA topoisomerase II
LANIFSTEFVIETCDGPRERRYRQVFTKNMSKKGEPRITSCKPKDNWTCVEFKPDYARFGMEGMEEDTVALMRKRTYDLAGVLGKTVKVYYNGQRLPVKSFQDYVNLYLGTKDSGVARVYEKAGERWEVVVSPTDGQFQQVCPVKAIPACSL